MNDNDLLFAVLLSCCWSYLLNMEEEELEKKKKNLTAQLFNLLFY